MSLARKTAMCCYTKILVLRTLVAIEYFMGVMVSGEMSGLKRVVKYQGSEGERDMFQSYISINTFKHPQNKTKNAQLSMSNYVTFFLFGVVWGMSGIDILNPTPTAPSPTHTSVLAQPRFINILICKGKHRGICHWGLI